jgi:heme-degrading monooxygenase HmoA
MAPVLEVYMRTTLLNVVIASLLLLSTPVFSHAEDRATQTPVIEIVTFKLKQGVKYFEFQPLDQAVQVQHVANQPGFISRESATGEQGEWLVIVHWRSIADVDASMMSFMDAPAAQAFLSKIDIETMSMKRYTKP